MRNIKPTKAEGLSIHDKLSDKPSFPSFSIPLEHIPEAKDWKLGEKHHIALHAKLVGLSQSRYQNEANFEIHKIGPDQKPATSIDNEEPDETDKDMETESDDEQAHEPY